jgi:hypothetical protein
MAYETTGTPVIMGNNGFGGEGLGALLIGALLFGGGFGGFGRGAGGAELGLTAGIQNQINGLSDQISSTQINGELNGIEAQLNAYNTANLQGIAANAQLYQTGNANIAAALERGNFTTLQSLNAQNLQSLNSFNQITTSMLQGFNEIGRDNANSFSQVQMSLNALSAQQAACCCDLKSAIHADGEATRSLINSINTQNLNTAIADLKSQVNTNAIINALKPVAIV